MTFPSILVFQSLLHQGRSATSVENPSIVLVAVPAEVSIPSSSGTVCDIMTKRDVIEMFETGSFNPFFIRDGLRQHASQVPVPSSLARAKALTPGKRSLGARSNNRITFASLLMATVWRFV